MPHILAIQGSPRKGGNTSLLLDRVLEGIRAAGASGKIVHLGDLTIRECDGCHACRRGKECPKRDDMNGLYPRIAQSDALVFGTPVYWYGPTALLKAFIDRLVYFNCPENRAKIRGKAAGIVVPFEEESLETAAPLVVMLERSFAWLELDYVGAVLAPGVGEKGAVLEHEGKLQEAADLGRLLAQMAAR